METLMREISNIKDDVVFVGSWVAKVNNKINTQPKDLDIVVTSLNGLETFGDIICGESTSPFAKNSKRCKIEGNEFMIDVWLQDELPQYDIINGMKFETIDAQKEYYSDVLDSTDNKFLTEIVNRKLSIIN
jgi:hypothetical protein